MIKFPLFCILTLIFLSSQEICSESNVTANSFDGNLKEPRIYFNPELIHISHDGIYVNYAGEWISLSSISFDDFGVRCAYQPVYDDDWRCYRGHWNYKNSKYCLECGAERTNSSPRWRDRKLKK